MATLYDSTNASDIPTTAEVVGGYVDGAYKWTWADWGRFPNAQLVSIAVFASTNNGFVLDVEDGCSTPAQAPAWAKMRRAAGIQNVTIYCSRSIMGDVASAFTAQGEPQPLYWIADWTGSPHLVPGSVATQYADPPSSGGHYDLSLTNGSWPIVSPPVPPKPLPPNPQEPSMNVFPHSISVTISNGQGWTGSPVPSSTIVSVVVADTNPDATGSYTNIPIFRGCASQTGPHTPSGQVLVFSGGANGTWAATAWSTQA